MKRINNTNKYYKIYLAGKMSGLSHEEMNFWRYYISNLIKKYADMSDYRVSIINPVDFYNFNEKRHKTEKEVMQYDLDHVRSSDVIIVNLDNVNTSVGTCIEIYEANRLNIPVLAFGCKNNIETLHPWLTECIRRIDDSMEDLVNYFYEFYLI